jgi:putative addiction module killer protein
MIEVRQTEVFRAWLGSLRNIKAKEVIARRIARIQSGLMGDVEPVGEGVSEARVNFGPGYGLYLVQRGRSVVILLCGGDKGSQERDIRKAKEMAALL